MATLSHAPQQGTFSALRHHNFRLYFGGQFISISGMWMQTVAQGWLVYHLTRSELMLGLVACAAGLPSLLFSPFAGVIVDRFHRRSILLVTHTLEMILALVLAWLTLSGLVQVWHVLLLALCDGVVKTFDAPARQSFIKDMVGPEDLPSGITLNSLMVNGARIIGPAFAGMLLVTVGAGWCFFYNGISFLAVLVSMLFMHLPPMMFNPRRASPLQEMREGWHYSRHHPVITPLLLLAAVVSVFAVNMVTVMPSFAATVLHSPINGYSTLSTSQGIGAVMGALMLAFLTRRWGRGRLAAVMTIELSLACILLSRMTLVPLAALFIGMVGMGFVLFFVTANTMLQNAVPDEFRGRVMSLFTLTFLGLTPFAALAMGYIAERIGTPNTMTLYGLLNGLFCVLILLRWPDVRAIE